MRFESEAVRPEIFLKIFLILFYNLFVMEDCEVWKDIPGYEGLYQVSNLGRVKSMGNDKSKKEKLLNSEKTIWGYLRVCLYKNNVSRHYSIHKLVASTFIHNPENLPCINHKDCNRTNNNVSNLEWCTQKYNVNYGDCLNKRINTKNKNKTYGAQKPVVQISLDNKPIKIFSSISETDFYGFNHGAVSACCLGKRKNHKGYKWMFFLPPALPLK